MGENQKTHYPATDGGDDIEAAREAFLDHPWVELTEHPGACRMLRAFLDAQTMDLNKSDLAEMADIGRRTVHNNIDLLVDLGLVEETREVGGAPMYRLRSRDKSDAVDGFIHFHDALGAEVGLAGSNGTPE